MKFDRKNYEVCEKTNSESHKKIEDNLKTNKRRPKNK